MLKNTFTLDGMVTKLSRMKDENGVYKAVFFYLAQLGSSFKVYILKENLGSFDIKDGMFVSVQGKLKNKNFVQGENRIACNYAIDVEHIEEIKSPFGK